MPSSPIYISRPRTEQFLEAIALNLDVWLQQFLIEDAKADSDFDQVRDDERF